MSRARVHILLVDDDPAGAELTAAVLADIGLAGDIDIVGDGEEALDYLHGCGRFGRGLPGTPDVILLDLKMPKLDGHEVLRQVRADPTLRATRVVILTSSDRERDMVQSREIGADAYVLKSVSIDELTSRLDGLGAIWTRPDPSPAPGA